MKIENETVTLKYHSLTDVTIKCYPMSLELLYSANPFVT